MNKSFSTISCIIVILFSIQMHAMHNFAPSRKELRQKHYVELRQAKAQKKLSDLLCNTDTINSCFSTKHLLALTLITLLVFPAQAYELGHAQNGYSLYQQQVNPSLKQPNPYGYSTYQQQVNPSLVYSKPSTPQHPTSTPQPAPTTANYATFYTGAHYDRTVGKNYPTNYGAANRAIGR